MTQGSQPVQWLVCWIEILYGCVYLKHAFFMDLTTLALLLRQITERTLHLLDKMQKRETADLIKFFFFFFFNLNAFFYFFFKLNSNWHYIYTHTRFSKNIYIYIYIIFEWYTYKENRFNKCAYCFLGLGFYT